MHITTTNLRLLLQHGIMSLIYLMDYILHQIFKIILRQLLRTITRTMVDNPLIQINVNRIKDFVVFQTKTGYKF